MTWTRFIPAGLALLAALISTSCGSQAKINEAAAAPPSAQVVEEPDLNVVKVDHPERFQLVTAGEHEDLPEVRATGSVTADVDKSVPVVALVSGRVVGIYAKLGDDVRKGQLLLKIRSNDISNAFQAYDQAKADEKLAQTQYDRAKLLYDKGAIALNDLQVAEDTQAKANVTLNAAAQQLQTLGGDVNNRQDPVVEIHAPVSGTIVEQNVVDSARIQTPDNQPNLFTIADLATVWVICDVYENDLPIVRLGDTADIELGAYPGRVFHGRIGNIGKILDSNIRTAKVRIELANPGLMRSGMFVTATFYGLHGQKYATAPATAILHLHDREWVFVPISDARFRRTEVTAGKTVNGMQEVIAGLAPGQQVVRDALELSAESEQ